MRSFRKVWLLSLVIMAMGSLDPASRLMAQPAGRISFDTFYQELAPHGRWVSDRQYGRVWIPRVERDFQPYASRGYWVMTEYGNTWVSDYEWGWAPFHYGRWAFDDLYGWVWIPDSEWGPAWVSWRSDDQYYGWAPLGPGANINININIPLSRWVFVPKRYIASRNFYSYCVPVSGRERVYSRTRIIDNTYERNNRRYFSGPGRDEVERVTRTRVPIHKIEDTGRPSRSVAENGSFKVYRPAINGRNEYRDAGRDAYERGNTYNGVDRSPSRSARPDNREDDGRSGNYSRGRPQNTPSATGRPVAGSTRPERERSTLDAQRTEQPETQQRRPYPADRTGTSGSPGRSAQDSGSPADRGSSGKEQSGNTSSDRGSSSSSRSSRPSRG